MATCIVIIKSFQPPGDLREKVKWRLLTSKPVVDSLNELMSKVYPEAAKTKHSGRPKLPAAGNRLSDDQSQTDEHLASLVEEGVPSGELSRDGLNSVFVSSLSAHASSVISHARGGGSRRDGAKERVPHKKRKVNNAVANSTLKKSCLIFIDFDQKKQARTESKKKVRLSKSCSSILFIVCYCLYLCRLWEEKYGRKAKHLTRIGSKRKSKLSVEHYCLVINNDMVEHNNATDVKARKETLSVEAGERENLGSVEVLHPSWAAKRQQRAAIEQFQGQKIVFDSD